MNLELAADSSYGGGLKLKGVGFELGIHLINPALGQFTYYFSLFDLITDV